MLAMAELIIHSKPKILNCTCPRCQDNRNQKIGCEKCRLIYTPELRNHIPQIYSYNIQKLLSEDNELHIFAQAEVFREPIFEIYRLYKSFGNWEVEPPKIVDKQNTKVECIECGYCNNCVSCAKCGATYSHEKNKCPRCSSSKKKQAHIVLKTVHRCTKCKADLEQPLLKCPECGGIVKPYKVCPSCGSRNVDSTKFVAAEKCPLCGSERIVKGYKFRDYELVISRLKSYRIENLTVDDGSI